MSTAWDKEQVFFSSDEFFGDLIKSIDDASKSINIEMYIFHLEQMGQRLALHLLAAAKRGVKVRILIDGVGSYPWIDGIHQTLKRENIDIAIYHPLPAHKYLIKQQPPKTRKKALNFWGIVNKRNHRKTCIIDERTAWAGSINVADYHLKEFSGDKAWRDTAVKVEGEEVAALIFAFEKAWNTAKTISLKRFKKIRGKYSKLTTLVRLNFNYKLSRRFYRDLLTRIRLAKEKIHITNAYFVPRRSLFRALKSAAKRGIDVKIIVPSASDVFFLPWVSFAFYKDLIKSGVKIFEYQPSMLHAKTMIVDEWAIIGSTNLNHRSFKHDLEADVVVTFNENRGKVKPTIP